MNSSWKDASRIAWENGSLSDAQLGTERLTVGCLQRIADATEKMAHNYQQLITERDRYERWYEQEKRSRQALERRVAALRGRITKLLKANVVLEAQ